MNAAGKWLHSGESRIFQDNRRVERTPRVFVEPAADHFTVFGPLVVRIERGVDADETFAVFFDERHDSRLFDRRSNQLAGGAGEDNGVEIIQVFEIAFFGFFLGDVFGVGAEGGFPKAGIVAHFVDGGHGVGNGIVFEPIGLRDHKTCGTEWAAFALWLSQIHAGALNLRDA